MSLDQNREAWLIDAAKAMMPWFDCEVPPFRVSVGPLSARTAGECWAAEATSDGIAQIFVTASRGEDDTVNVLGTLLHEMCHAIAGHEAGHRRGFIDVAKPLGFISKWTSSSNRTAELSGRLEALAEQLGRFPTGSLQGLVAADAPKKQVGSRMLKVICGTNPDYKVRTTRKMLEEYGYPSCPCHGDEMELA